MIEHHKEFVGVWVVFLDLFGDDDGVWVVGWYVGEISLCALSDSNDLGEDDFWERGCGD